MFGYVRPNKARLLVCELEQFRAVYCGLCHTLRERYGIFVRNLLHYDFVFLALVLERDDCAVVRRRCPASPFKRRCVCAPGESLDKAADATVLMAYHKFSDNVADSGFFRGLGARLARAWLRPKYRRAAERLPSTDLVCRRALAELAEMEKEKLASLDAPADTFARMLSALSELESGTRARILEKLLYHLGRWIYLVDACDDLERDQRRGAYNPIAERFSLGQNPLDGETRDSMEITLAFSRSEALKAYALWEDAANRALVLNILGLGLPAAEREALDSKKKRRKPDERPL